MFVRIKRGFINLGTKIVRAITEKPEQILLLFAFVPLIMLVDYLSERAQIVPWLDEWSSSYPVVRQFFEGTLSLDQVARFNVDHRIFFPNILTIIFASISRWNAWFDVTFSLAISIISILMIYDVYLRQHRTEHAKYLIIPFSLLFLSLGQRENWIWGFQKPIFMVTFSVSLAAWGLDRYSNTAKGFAISLACAWFGAWSFASGNLLWFIIPIALWMNGFRRRWFYLVWTSSAVLSFVLYLQNFPTSRIANFTQLFSNFNFVRYGLIFLGAPFSDQVNHLGFWAGILSTRTAGLYGVLGVLLLIANVSYYFIVRKENVRQFSPWMLLVLYSITSGLLLSVGRSVNLLHALIARYTTLALPFWVALVAIMISNISHAYSLLARSNRLILISFASNILSIGLLCVGYVFNVNEAYKAKTFRDEIANCMVSKLKASERCSIGGFFRWANNNDTVLDGITYLAENDLSIFAKDNFEITYDIKDIPIIELGPQTGTEFRLYSIEDVVEFVLFQHAPSSIELSVEILRVDQRVRFLSAAYLDPINVLRESQVSQDGVFFQIHIRDESGVESLVFKTQFDPHKDRVPKPISIDLSPYVGEVIRMRFDTDDLQNPYYDWSMWVNPRIEITDW